MRPIALIGDYSPDKLAHVAIPRALKASPHPSTFEWIETAALGGVDIESFSGIWAVPGSPYADAAAVIRAIRFARTNGVPFLGTCGGFQHALMEISESLWGVVRAAHAEEEPDALDPVISLLECAMVEADGEILLEPRSRLREIYGADHAVERYRCRYGLNRLYEPNLLERPLRVSARDAAGEIRGFELDDHPFFVGVAFQPEREGLHDRSHPTVDAFLAACAR